MEIRVVDYQGSEMEIKGESDAIDELQRVVNLVPALTAELAALRAELARLRQVLASLGNDAAAGEGIVERVVRILEGEE